MICEHITLTKCRVGLTSFYKCIVCKKNFAVPKPFVIKVTHPTQALADLTKVEE